MAVPEASARRDAARCAVAAPAEAETRTEAKAEESWVTGAEVATLAIEVGIASLTAAVVIVSALGCLTLAEAALRLVLL